MCLSQIYLNKFQNKGISIFKSKHDIRQIDFILEKKYHSVYQYFHNKDIFNNLS